MEFIGSITGIDNLPHCPASYEKYIPDNLLVSLLQERVEDMRQSFYQLIFTPGTGCCTHRKTLEPALAKATCEYEDSVRDEEIALNRKLEAEKLYDTVNTQLYSQWFRGSLFSGLVALTVINYYHYKARKERLKLQLESVTKTYDSAWDNNTAKGVALSKIEDEFYSIPTCWETSPSNRCVGCGQSRIVQISADWGFLFPEYVRLLTMSGVCTRCHNPLDMSTDRMGSSGVLGNRMYRLCACWDEEVRFLKQTRDMYVDAAKQRFYDRYAYLSHGSRRYAFPSEYLSTLKAWDTLSVETREYYCKRVYSVYNIGWRIVRDVVYANRDLSPKTLLIPCKIANIIHDAVQSAKLFGLKPDGYRDHHQKYHCVLYELVESIADKQFYRDMYRWVALLAASTAADRNNQLHEILFNRAAYLTEIPYHTDIVRLRPLAKAERRRCIHAMVKRIVRGVIAETTKHEATKRYHRSVLYKCAKQTATVAIGHEILKRITAYINRVERKEYLSRVIITKRKQLAVTDLCEHWYTIKRNSHIGTLKREIPALSKHLTAKRALRLSKQVCHQAALKALERDVKKLCILTTSPSQSTEDDWVVDV